MNLDVDLGYGLKDDMQKMWMNAMDFDFSKKVDSYIDLYKDV